VNPFEMVVIVVGIACGTAVVGQVVDAFKAYLVTRAKRGSLDPAVHETLKAVRDEIAQLKHSSNDVVLTFDATLQRLDARLQHLEQQALASGRPAATLPSTAPARAAEEQITVNAR
jgi:hypothetical protein